MDNLKLYDAEYRFMTLIWENDPINSTKLVKLCHEGWEKVPPIQCSGSRATAVLWQHGGALKAKRGFRLAVIPGFAQEFP